MKIEAGYQMQHGQQFIPAVPQPHAAVSQRGPGNLRLRIIEWYKDAPAFIGLALPTSGASGSQATTRHKMAAAMVAAGLTELQSVTVDFWGGPQLHL